MCDKETRPLHTLDTSFVDRYFQKVDKSHVSTDWKLSIKETKTS